MSLPPVTLCVVAMNEEDRIEACLRSADFVDEIIVVDSHSTDRTREIAAALGARVFERDWTGFVAQKNYALEQASHDWVLFLDADERLAPDARTAVIDALSRHEDVDGYELSLISRVMGRWIRYGGWYPDRKLRLFRKSRSRFHGTEPHDRIHVEGRVGRLQGDILHEPYRSISDHLRKIDSYTTVAARDKLARGQKARLIDITLRPFGKFIRMYLLERGFLDGLPGFFLAITSSYYVFLKYIKLRSLEHESRAR